VTRVAEGAPLGQGEDKSATLRSELAQSALVDKFRAKGARSRISHTDDSQVAVPCGGGSGAKQAPFGGLHTAWVLIL